MANAYASASVENHQIAGKVITCLRFGSGRPVLLTHGIPGDCRSLAPVAARLSRKWEAITVSLPTPRTGDRPQRPFGTGGMADDLADLVATLGAGPVHLVAWSFSAHAALAMAARRPDLVASLFVFEPGFPTFLEDPMQLASILADQSAAFAAVETLAAAGDFIAAARASIDAAANEAGYFDSQGELAKAIHTDNAQGVAALFEQTPPIDLSPADIAGITCPVTIARGANTRVVYRLVTDGVARLLPNARFVIARLAGHMLPEQDPARFALLVSDHLDHAIRPKADF